MELTGEAVRGYLEYLRDLGIYDLYRQGEPYGNAEITALLQSLAVKAPAATPPTVNLPGKSARLATVPSGPAMQRPSPMQAAPVQTASLQTGSPLPGLPQPGVARPGPSRPQPLQARITPEIKISVTPLASSPEPSEFGQASTPEDSSVLASFPPPPMPLIPFNQLAPLPSMRVGQAEKPQALEAIRRDIGDCTRCPLAYAGRHSIVYADGNANADLMFVGEGPGADEDETGIPFVGKAGQLLNNMITAMGLKRESVYIANIVKCRPPKNRVPEPVEANTCSQFLLRQIDVVQPRVIVALGGTAATYLLGVKQPISALRGEWFDVRGAKCAVTYHPAFLLRDPRQKGEAWKDLQRVMVELALKPAKA